MADFGELLRQARDFKGVSLREAERATRINRSYLAALESENFQELPPATYARGIVRNYAQYLGLDAAPLLAQFETLTGAPRERAEVVAATRPLDTRSHWVPNFAIIAFMVVMSAIVFAWIYSAYFQPAESATATQVGVATVTPFSESLLAQVTVQTTVATQGGGAATTTPAVNTTPIPSATAAVTPDGNQAVQQPASQTPVPSVQNAPQPTAVIEIVPDIEPTVATDTGNDTDPTSTDTMDETTGAHSLVVWVTDDVWVQVSANGEVVKDDVLPAGTELTFHGDSFAVTSGNAAFVHVYVDGEDFGTLGDNWNSGFFYP
jgi:cytoskeleton protein RodZ